jgi:hypothetical protein
MIGGLITRGAMVAEPNKAVRTPAKNDPTCRRADYCIASGSAGFTAFVELFAPVATATRDRRWPCAVRSLRSGNGSSRTKCTASIPRSVPRRPYPGRFHPNKVLLARDLAELSGPQSKACEMTGEGGRDRLPRICLVVRKSWGGIDFQTVIHVSGRSLEVYSSESEAEA